MFFFDWWMWPRHCGWLTLHAAQVRSSHDPFQSRAYFKLYNEPRSQVNDQS